MVVTLILLSQGRGEGVVMATPILLLEGRRQGDYGPCLPLFLGSGGLFGNPWQGGQKRRGWPWPNPFLTLALLRRGQHTFTSSS